LQALWPGTGSVPQVRHLPDLLSQYGQQWPDSRRSKGELVRWTMSTNEQLSAARTPDQVVQPVNDQGPKPDLARPPLPARQSTPRNDMLIASLQRALQELVKAQDHLNAASDQGNEAISKQISGIIQSVRGLQREVSNVIHGVSCSK